ncbi:MAG: RdgB/HAM1 family non-canonical purine NTP pyrophosphatase [Alistipes sp.]|jgi:XTP/dITP diphosphohydrolase|nr:RdgB/HAM1 family non-canonical purine NTP pyrophosphatase [Alistipes sp.]
MRIIFATNNRHKLEEVSAILGPGFELVTPHEVGITEDIPETADTLEGNALQKARYIHERTGFDCFADDTGLEVAALGGAPGVYSARYAAMAGGAAGGGADAAKSGGTPTYDDNNRLLLRNLEGAKDRSARFRTVIALILGDGNIDGPREEYLFEGEVRGCIIDEYRGTEGFGYDPIFAPDGGNKTFSEMSAEQKNAISHRGRAVEKLKNFLSKTESKIEL